MKTVKRLQKVIRKQQKTYLKIESYLIKEIEKEDSPLLNQMVSDNRIVRSLSDQIITLIKLQQRALYCRSCKSFIRDEKYPLFGKCNNYDFKKIINTNLQIIEDFGCRFHEKKS
jgi:hypothetical protein